ncbi:E3 ubiquitin-protein ligase TRIM71-like [Dysidea avara]|uniref:E3 ubiquitin-protein ligase TRIM71-like n=1 Tax=Dysidea avara TaxID=196820 RepID=UPI00331CF8B7
MATNWEKVKEELTCAICQDLLNDPKILPCLHSFCAGCLKEWLGRLPYLDSSKRELECPLCRGKVALSTPRAVEELPSNFSAVRLVEIVRLQQQVSSKKVTPICQSCDEGEPAVSYCNECATFLCEFCETAHRRLRSTSGHKVCSMDELKKGSATDIPSILPEKVEKVEMCLVHPTKPLELYCRCEDVLICRDCIIKKHKGHGYDVISDVVDGEKKILKEALPSIQQLIDDVEGAINGVKSKRQDVKNRKLLRRKLSQDAEGNDKGLAVQEDELCFLLSQLKSCWSFIDDKLQRGVNKDVLAMKRSMLERRNKLKETKSKTKLNPIMKEQVPINLKGLKGILPFTCKKNSFTIQLKDPLSNDICNSKEIDVMVQYYNKNQITEAATIREIGGGSYEASYICKFGGSHTVSIQVGGERIPGSPFKVRTTLRDYTKIDLQSCQLITQYGGKKFHAPFNGTMTANDDIVLVDRENHDVVVLDKELKVIKTFGQGSGDSKLNDPIGVAVGHSVIAVSEYKDHVVKKFTLQGEYLSQFGSYGSSSGQFDHPQGLAFNSKGLLYVVGRTNCRVQVFDHSNNYLFKFGSKGPNPGQFQSPCYIALDSNDQVYVTDNVSGGGISKFSEDGHFIRKIDCNSPFAICLTPDDCIITNDVNYLTVFSPTHQLITKFGTTGSQKGQFDSITGITVNSASICVTEYLNHRLQIIAL